MRKLNKMAVVLGVMGVGVCVTLANNPAGMTPNIFSESFGSDSPKSDPLSLKWNDDGAKLDKTILLAQADTAGSASEAIVPAESAGGGAVAVKEASTWSDMTAIFRPSRWAHPIAAGGTLSWLNYHAWADAPWRTTKVLAGEVIIIGGTYFGLEALGVFGGGGGGGGAAVGGGELPY